MGINTIMLGSASMLLDFFDKFESKIGDLLTNIDLGEFDREGTDIRELHTVKDEDPKNVSNTPDLAVH